MAHKGSDDSYTINTQVSIDCKKVIHKEYFSRKANGEPDLRLKDVTAEWLEEVAKQKGSQAPQGE